MKLVILSDVYLPFLSGVSTVTYLLSREFPRFGVDTTLVIPSPSFYLKEVIDFDEKYRRKIIFVPSSKLFGIYGDLRFPVRFYVPFEEFGDDCIFNIHSPMILGTASIKKLRKLRDSKKIMCGFVGVFHTRMSDYLLRRINPKISKKLARLLDFYTKHIFNRMDVTIVVSSYLDRIAKKMGIRNTVVLPNPLNRVYFREPKKSVDHYYDFLEPKEYFMYLGRISHEKRVDSLAHLVCRKSLPYKFVFAGTGPLLDSLKEVYGDGNCVFPGKVPFSAQLALYRDAIALVSASDWETQGMVFLEAMAQGTPVIASKFGGQADYLVHNYNALLFEDPKKILDFMMKIYKDEDLREYLGVNARKTAEKFHPNSIIPRYINLFKSILDKLPL